VVLVRNLQQVCEGDSHATKQQKWCLLGVYNNTNKKEHKQNHGEKMIYVKRLQHGRQGH